MKKLLLIVGLLLGFATFSMAQTTNPKKDAKTSTKAKDSTKKSTTAPTKKDGTPDMRYKANKDAAKTKTDTTVHKKKDGTPDKRYKENKPKKG